MFTYSELLRKLYGLYDKSARIPRLCKKVLVPLWWKTGRKLIVYLRERAQFVTALAVQCGPLGFLADAALAQVALPSELNEAFSKDEVQANSNIAVVSLQKVAHVVELVFARESNYLLTSVQKLLTVLNKNVAQRVVSGKHGSRNLEHYDNLISLLSEVSRSSMVLQIAANQLLAQIQFLADSTSKAHEHEHDDAYRTAGLAVISLQRALANASRRSDVCAPCFTDLADNNVDQMRQRCRAFKNDSSQGGLSNCTPDCSGVDSADLSTLCRM